MSFDWRTEEERAWAPERVPAHPPAGSSARRAILLSLLLITAGAIVFYVYREVARVVATTEEAVTGDILATHELMTMAARSADPELLRTVLSGTDEGWARAQARRIENGAAAGLAHFGLQPLGDTGAPDVTLDPEQRAAELAWPARFVVTDSAGNTETIQLAQTAVYRRGRNRWLYAPPRAGFWGGRNDYRGTYLEAVFPERDETIARRLAADLDDLIAGLCRRRTCPDRFRLHLVLSTDPGAFEGLDMKSLLGAGRTLALPTPTLVGLPADEAAYAALWRGYARLLSTAVLGDLAGFACCRGEVYAAAWLHYQQHHLGLRPWPLDAAAYERLLLQMPSLTDYLLLLRRKTPEPSSLAFEEWAPVYAFAQFLEEEVRPLLAARAVNVPYPRLLQIAGANPRGWSSAFARFVYEKSQSGQLAEPPARLPAAALVLSCNSGNGDTVLRSYDLRTASWQTLYQDPLPAERRHYSYSYAEPLGNRNGAIIVTRRTTMGENGSINADFSLQLATPGSGHTTTLLNSSATRWDQLPLYRRFRGGHDPQGRYLVLADYSPGRGTGAGRYNYSLVDLRRCNGSSCPISSLPGPVAWSPSGEATLIVAGNLQPGSGRPAELYLADGSGRNLERLANSDVAAWLDDTHYAYVTAGTARPELVVRALPDNAERQRFPLANLWPLAGSRGPALSAGLAAQRLIPHPQDPRQFVVGAAWTHTGFSGESDLFLVRLTADWADVADSRHLGAQERANAFSATGRWLTLQAAEKQNGGELVDLAAPPHDPGAVRSLPPQAQVDGWAPSGDWLPLNADSYLLLNNPSAGYTTFIPFEDESCLFSTWLRPLG